MSEIPWYTIVESVTPYIVRITTPDASGTGFLIASSKKLHAIATVDHVVSHANYWNQPIRIFHQASKKAVLLEPDDRAIFSGGDTDAALIVFESNEIPFKEETIPMLDPTRFLKVGNEVGWLGFPTISKQQLCFFSGRVSAAEDSKKPYLIDGVAVNGVSGGPVFGSVKREGKPKVMIIGVVSSYIPNRSSGVVLPGLLEVRSVKKLHEMAKDFTNLVEAKKEVSQPPVPMPSPQLPNAVSAQ